MINKTINFNLLNVKFNAEEETVTLSDGQVYSSTQFLCEIMEHNQFCDLVISVRGAN